MEEAAAERKILRFTAMSRNDALGTHQVIRLLYESILPRRPISGNSPRLALSASLFEIAERSGRSHQESYRVPYRHG